MFYLFKHKNILPSTYYNLGFGEKKILKAFVRQEAEDFYKASKNKDIYPTILIK